MRKRLPVVQPSPLPPLYAAWMDQLLGGPIPRETEATCDDCAMCATEGPGAEVAQVFFDPRTKCCTYVPALANFLVGRLLADDDPAAADGRATVEARLRAGVAVTPLGLGQPPTFTLLYQNTAASSFGRSPSLRCPHYLHEQGGRCGVWKHRASVCATWFCKHVRGATGIRFWQSVQQLLAGVEGALARWCVLELDVGPEALRRLFPPHRAPGPADTSEPCALDDLVDRDLSRAVWGRWHGREVEFYRECARLTGGLAWEDVVAISGPDTRIHARLALTAYAALTSEETPARLEVGGITIVRMGRAICRVSAYSVSDPLDLPKALMDVLPYFDGRTTDQALQAIEDHEGLRIDRTLVRRLVDFEILVPVTRGWPRGEASVGSKRDHPQAPAAP
ncbi:MAG: hypothetical protein ACREM3_05220 [Candidatus Rokuibacteriota bacterium]